tara:strand:+ start:277 stop:537 length:261 start_codon:yes stop_codon:yes gene_type:complete
MSRIKFAKLDVDKSASQLANNVKRRGLKTRITNGVVNASDVKPGEFVFTSLKKGQEGPSNPTSDESRIYFKDKDGNFFKFTGTKVG